MGVASSDIPRISFFERGINLTNLPCWKLVALSFPFEVQWQFEGINTFIPPLVAMKQTGVNPTFDVGVPETDSMSFCKSIGLKEGLEQT